MNAQWRSMQIYDEWKEGINAGASEKYYWQNTQFLIEVNTPNYHNSKHKSIHTSIIIGLMQPYSAQMRIENNGDSAFIPIRFDLYSVICDEKKIIEYKLDKRKFREADLKMVDSIGAYSEGNKNKFFNFRLL